MSKDRSIDDSQNTLSNNLMDNTSEKFEKPLADQSTAATQSLSNISIAGFRQKLKKYMGSKN